MAGIDPTLQAQAEAENDPFRHAEQLPGLFHLGRAITDMHGAPSGSPANYEYTRGMGEPDVPVQLSDETVQEHVRQILSEFPVQ